MKNKRLAALVVAILAICLLSPSLFAEEKMVGVITKIDISGPDATTATVTLKDTKTDELVVIVINDELTLDKLKDHRIVLDDEIRCKYETEDGRNVSTYFRKTAGC